MRLPKTYVPIYLQLLVTLKSERKRTGLDERTEEKN